MGKSTALTQKMTEALLAADLERGELDNLPLTVGVGLLRRKLIEDDWTTGQAQSSTIGFPRYNGVKLTAKGIEAAAHLRKAGSAAS